ncbi:MAG: hypothetical protein KF912_01485 [Phycisphaeraceae bacterium]|nr:hypothetical protein [Phycisphaeraceae bacterium]
MRIVASIMLSTLAASAGATGPTPWTSVDGAMTTPGICPEHFMLNAPVRIVRPAPPVVSRSDEITFLSTEDGPDGDSSRDIVFTRDGTQAVIINAQTNTMTFLSIASRTITHSVDVGEYPVGVAVTPDGRYALAVNVLSNTLSVVDIATHTEIAQVPISGDQPYRVAVTPDSQHAIVGVINDAVFSAFSVVDLDTLAEIRVIDASSQGVIGGYFTPEYGIYGDSFTAFALSADGTKIIYPQRFQDTIYIYDVATGAQLAALPTFDQPTAVDVSPVGNFAVVSCEGSSRRVVRVNLDTNTIDGSFATSADNTWQKVRVTPDGTHAIVSQLNEIEFVNLSTGTLTRLSTGSPGDIEFSADGLYAFISNFSSRVINLATRSQVASVTFAASAEAATSPVANIAVALNNRFGEDVHVYNINGASSSFLGFSLTGLGLESDSTRELAITPDGRRLFFGNCTSRSGGFVELGANTFSALTTTAFRTLDAAATPDGAYVVATHADGQTVSIIDTSTRTTVANLPVFDRPARVLISPDSAYAYVLSIAGTDRVHKIALNGASSSVVATQIAGQAGAVGYSFSEFSGIALSPDGSLIAVCRSFDDLLRLIDTSTMAVVADVPCNPTGNTDFPIRVTFNSTGTRAYVSTTFGDTITVVNIAGAASSVVTNVPGIDAPLSLDLDASDAYLYVGTAGFGTGRLAVIDTATNSVVRTVLLGANGTIRSTYMSPVDGKLYAAGSDNNGGRLWIFNAAGASTTLDRSIELSASPADLAFSESLGQAIVSLPVPDGIEIVQVRPRCTADYNGDTLVDILDFLDFMDDFSVCDQQNGPCGQFGNTDFTGDTVVDILDFLDFMDGFGTQSGTCGA